MTPLKLRPEVAAFAQLMETKLRENDHKGGWRACDVDWLYTRLEEEARELYCCKLELARLGKDYGMVDAQQERVKVGREAADVANFAMMIADVCGALALTPPTQRTGQPGRPSPEPADPAASSPLTCETCEGEGVVQVYPPGERDCKDCEGERCPQHMPTAKKCTPCRGTGKRDTGTPAPLVCHVCGKPATCVGQYEAMTEALPACDECCGHGCEDGHCDRINEDDDEPARDTGTPPGARVPQAGEVWRYTNPRRGGATEWEVTGTRDVSGRVNAWNGKRTGGFHPADFTDGTLTFVRRGTPGAGGS